MVSCARFLGREAPMARWPMHVQGFCGMDVVARGRGSDALVGGAGEWVARRALGQPQIGGHVGAWSATVDVRFRRRHCPRGSSMGVDCLVDCLVDCQDGRFRNGLASPWLVSRWPMGVGLECASAMGLSVAFLASSSGQDSPALAVARACL